MRWSEYTRLHHKTSSSQISVRLNLTYFPTWYTKMIHRLLDEPIVFGKPLQHLRLYYRLN